METMTKKSGNGNGKGALGRIVESVGELAGTGVATNKVTLATDPLSFTGVKVFSATKQFDRNLLGDVVTDWLRAHPDVEIVDKVVTQSSDSEFHCLTITLFYKDK